MKSPWAQVVRLLGNRASFDATGSYHRYEFDFVPDFPDYPKFGIWPDAYYNSINVFGDRGFAGAEACAFDRAAMLAGAAASAICFQQPPSVSSLLPSDLDGSTLPPAGAPNYFVGIADEGHLNLFRFYVDFRNPSASSFTGPTLIDVAPFNEICARAITRSCIPQGSALRSEDNARIRSCGFRSFPNARERSGVRELEWGLFAG